MTRNRIEWGRVGPGYHQRMDPNDKINSQISLGLKIALVSAGVVFGLGLIVFGMEMLIR